MNAQRRIQIAEVIPFGHDNGVSREELIRRTGLPDRLVRDAINKSDALIINLQDGKGYFQPNPDEGHLVDAWIRIFRSRIEDEGRRVCKAMRWRNHFKRSRR